MAAMIWDNESQAFKEADVPMKYDPTAGAWTDTTGLAWDNEAQAWTERWGTKVSAYVYGAALETVTIRKDGIIVTTVQTDASGKSVEQITLYGGTYTLTGSVSGWTEEQTVDSSTTKFRAMPEGALYWFGYSPYSWNKLKYTGSGSQTTASDSEVREETNRIVLNANSEVAYYYYLCKTMMSVTTSDKIHLYAGNPDKNLPTCYIYTSLNVINSTIPITYTLVGQSENGYYEKCGSPTSNVSGYITLVCERYISYLYAVWIE